MKKKIGILINRLKEAITTHPVEVLLSVTFSLAGCVYYESNFKYDFLSGPLSYFPVLFLLTYTLNGLTLHKKLRPLYFLSAFFFIPFLWLDKEKIWTPTYVVSLVTVQLLYLISSWKRDNDEFVRIGLRYLKSVLSAGLLAGIAYQLAVSIYASVRYIFEIWENSYRGFYTESAYLIFICGMPLLFLLFNQAREEKEESRNRLFEVLLNYVLSPALLIYAVILYLYFIKVAILWSLPKGAVAYIVVSFISATFVLKGCQVFLSKRYYDWFYKYASFAVLPALAMYWVGVYYRINQYGFTEPRVYLVSVGAILTALTILFFTKRWGRYLYASCLAIVFLGVVTYIPGITAKDIELISQEGRDNDPEDSRRYADPYIYLENDYPIDISSYSTLAPVVGYKSPDKMWTTTLRDSLFLYDKAEKLLYSESLFKFWNNQLEQAGLAPFDSIPQESYPSLLELEIDSGKLVFQTIALYRICPDTICRISHITPAYYLTKNKSE